MPIGIPGSCSKWPVIALCSSLLLVVEGLNIYLTVILDAFRTGIPRLPGQIGRMTLILWPNIALVQVIISKQAGVWDIRRVIVQGEQGMIDHLLHTTQGGEMINTAYIE